MSLTNYTAVFLYRYIPVGLLERIPQRINDLSLLISSTQKHNGAL